MQSDSGNESVWSDRNVCLRIDRRITLFYEWPRYDKLGEEETPEALEHLHHRYCASLTMADKWIGKFLDKMLCDKNAV